jgi:hypothetical protein
MWPTNIIYQFVRGPDGLPSLVRIVNQNSPGTEAPRLFLTSTAGATPQEEYLDDHISYHTTPVNPCTFTKSPTG